MTLVLDPKQLHATRRALLAPTSSDLIAFMYRSSLGLPVDRVGPETVAAARELGWLQANSFSLSALGELVADPLREYQLWLDRDRKLHDEGSYELLAAERYAGKAVLEPGCGFGCNLLSLAGVGGRFVGVEPVAVYRQLAPILAEREHVAAPEVVAGRAESLPFADGEFDVVLCYSSHQYMDVRKALREMTRVLRPGGQLQIIGRDFAGYVGLSMRRILLRRDLRRSKSLLFTVANTLAYELSGQRLLVPGGHAATTAPIHPSHGFMHQWIEASGLRMRDDLSRKVGSGMCVVADKS